MNKRPPHNNQLRLVAWEMTRSCNLNCVHCRASSEHGPYPGELDTKKCLEILDQIAQTGEPIVILTGGEPLLRKDIFDLARHGTQLGLRMVMATNGTLLTPAITEQLSSSGIKRVSISLDGASVQRHDQFRKVPGAFKAALEGVELLKRADMIGVVDCDCRRIYQSCDKPLWTCLNFGKSIIEYEVGRGGRMKVLNVEEAIATSDMAEEAGLVHTTPVNSSSMPGIICNCCNDCCATLEPGIESGKLDQIIAPSRFRAVVNQELCKGCQVCSKRCPFGAIEMQPIPDSDKLKASIINDKCLGCGVCVIGCKQEALSFELVRPPEHIPAVSVLEMMRQERGS